MTSCTINKGDSKKIQQPELVEIKTTDSLAKNSKDYKVNIIKIDSLHTYTRPTNYQELRFKEYSKKYKPRNKFESKIVYLDTSTIFLQSAVLKRRQFSFPEIGFDKYVTKQLIQNFNDIHVEGGSNIKQSIQIFPINPQGKIDAKPLYSFQTYADNLKVYDYEGYFVSIQGGCCSNTNRYEVFDLNGKYILNSNHSIKVIKTDNENYFISALKQEEYDLPVIFIKNSKGETQYISFSPIQIDNIIVEDNFYLKFAKDKEIRTSRRYYLLDEYTTKSLSDLEIWIPFNKKDTLKIPFKNQKAFGVDYPQLKVKVIDVATDKNN
jgi:hypothetical protein